MAAKEERKDDGFGNVLMRLKKYGEEVEGGNELKKGKTRMECFVECLLEIERLMNFKGKQDEKIQVPSILEIARPICNLLSNISYCSSILAGQMRSVLLIRRNNAKNGKIKPMVGITDDSELERMFCRVINSKGISNQCKLAACMIIMMGCCGSCGNSSLDAPQFLLKGIKSSNDVAHQCACFDAFKLALQSRFWNCPSKFSSDIFKAARILISSVLPSPLKSYPKLLALKLITEIVKNDPIPASLLLDGTSTSSSLTPCVKCFSDPDIRVSDEAACCLASQLALVTNDAIRRSQQLPHTGTRQTHQQVNKWSPANSSTFLESLFYKAPKKDFRYRATLSKAWSEFLLLFDDSFYLDHLETILRSLFGMLEPSLAPPSSLPGKKPPPSLAGDSFSIRSLISHVCQNFLLRSHETIRRNALHFITKLLFGALSDTPEHPLSPDCKSVLLTTAAFIITLLPSTIISTSTHSLNQGEETSTQTSDMNDPIVGMVEKILPRLCIDEVHEVRLASSLVVACLCMTNPRMATPFVKEWVAVTTTERANIEAGLLSGSGLLGRVSSNVQRKHGPLRLHGSAAVVSAALSSSLPTLSPFSFIDGGVSEGIGAFAIHEALALLSIGTGIHPLVRSSVWMLVGSVVSLGVPFVKPHLGDLFSAWNRALKESTALSQPNKNNPSMSALVEECILKAEAVKSLASFLFHCPSLATPLDKQVSSLLSCILRWLSSTSSLFPIEGELQIVQFSRHAPVGDGGSGDEIQPSLFERIAVTKARTILRTALWTAYTALSRASPSRSGVNWTSVLKAVAPDLSKGTESSIIMSFLPSGSFPADGDNCVCCGSSRKRRRRLFMHPHLRNSLWDDGWSPFCPQWNAHFEISETRSQPTLFSATFSPDDISSMEINAVLRVFGCAFARQSSKNQHQTIEHFVDCIKTCPPSSKRALKRNLTCAILSSLDEMKRIKMKFENVVLLPTANFCRSFLSDEEDDLLIRAAGEALGNMACCSQDHRFPNEEASRLISMVRQQNTALEEGNSGIVFDRTGGGCLALGCLVRSAGGMTAASSIAPASRALQQAVFSSSFPSVSPWAAERRRNRALYSLRLCVEAAGSTFSPLAFPTLTLLNRILISPLSSTLSPKRHSRSSSVSSPLLCPSGSFPSRDTCKAVGRVVHAIMNAMGPELSASASFPCVELCNQITIGISVRENGIQNFLSDSAIPQVSDLIAHRFTFLRDIGLFARNSPHLDLSWSPSLLRTFLSQDWPSSSPSYYSWDSVEVRRDCVAALRQLAIDYPDTVFRKSNDESLEMLLVRKLDLERGRNQRAASEIRALLLSATDQLSPNDPARWVAFCRDILLPRATSSEKGIPSKDARDDDVGGLMGSQSISRPSSETTFSPSWTTKLFATEMLSRIISSSRLPSEKVDSDQEYHLGLLKSVSDAIMAAYSASNSDADLLRIAGMQAMKSIIKSFGSTHDPEMLDSQTPHFLLEQHRAQIFSAIRTNLGDGAPSMASLVSCDLCASYAQAKCASDGIAVKLATLLFSKGLPNSNISPIDGNESPLWGEEPISKESSFTEWHSPVGTSAVTAACLGALASLSCLKGSKGIAVRKSLNTASTSSWKKLQMMWVDLVKDTIFMEEDAISAEEEGGRLFPPGSFSAPHENESSAERASYSWSSLLPSSLQHEERQSFLPSTEFRKRMPVCLRAAASFCEFLTHPDQEEIKQDDDRVASAMANYLASDDDLDVMAGASVNILCSHSASEEDRIHCMSALRHILQTRFTRYKLVREKSKDSRDSPQDPPSSEKIQFELEAIAAAETALERTDGIELKLEGARFSSVLIQFPSFSRPQPFSSVIPRRAIGLSILALLPFSPTFQKSQGFGHQSEATIVQSPELHQLCATAMASYAQHLHPQDSPQDERALIASLTLFLRMDVSKQNDDIISCFEELLKIAPKQIVASLAIDSISSLEEQRTESVRSLKTSVIGVICFLFSLLKIHSVGFDPSLNARIAELLTSFLHTARNCSKTDEVQYASFILNGIFTWVRESPTTLPLQYLQAIGSEIPPILKTLNGRPWESSKSDSSPEVYLELATESIKILALSHQLSPSDAVKNRAVAVLLMRSLLGLLRPDARDPLHEMALQTLLKLPASIPQFKDIAALTLSEGERSLFEESVRQTISQQQHQQRRQEAQMSAPKQSLKLDISKFS